jgi:hypothetical protein
MTRSQRLGGTPVGLVQWVVPPALYIIGMWGFPLALMGPGLAYVPGDLGDARFINYLLEHFHLSLAGRTPGFWDAPFMHPWPRTVALSDNLWGTGPFYSLFRHLGHDRENAMQLWILLLFTLNYWCCLLSLRLLRIRPAVAAAGAFIFAFGIFHLGQINHPQLLQRAAIPFAVVLFFLWLRQGSPRHLAWCALAVVAQFYASIYLAMFLLYMLFFMAVARLLLQRDLAPWTRVAPRHLLMVAGGAALLLLPLMLPYMEVARHMGVRTFQEIAHTIPRPVSYFFTHPGALSWRVLAGHSQYAFEGWWFHFLFLGGLPWAAVLALPVVLLHPRVDTQGRAGIAMVALAILLSILFCLRLGEFSLFKWVHMLPGFSALRVADRVILVLVMPFVLLLSLMVERLPRAGLWAGMVAVIIPLAAVMDNRMEFSQVRRYDKENAREMVQEVVRHMQQQYDGTSTAIAYAPVHGVLEKEADHIRDIHLHITAMLAAQQIGLPVVNAYTSWYPEGYMEFFDHKDRRSIANWSKRMGISSRTIQSINNLGLMPDSLATVDLITIDGYLVDVDLQRDALAFADNVEKPSDGSFRAVYLPGGRVALLASNDRFLASDLSNHGVVRASARVPDDTSIFFMDAASEGGWFALRMIDGGHVVLGPDRYLRSSPTGSPIDFRIISHRDVRFDPGLPDQEPGIGSLRP